MHVGQFLELERALQRHRVADVPADEQHLLRGGEVAGELADRLHRLQHGAQLVRHLLELLDDGADLVRVLDPADLREVQADQVAGDELGEERLVDATATSGPPCV